MADMTAAAATIADEFGLGRVVSWEPVGGAGRGVARLTATAGVCIAKPVGDRRWLPLYAEVETRLNAAGVRQARALARPDGGWAASTGHALLELLPGVPAQQLTSARLGTAVAYLARYHTALASVPAPAWLRQTEGDPWRQAASIEALTQEVAPRLTQLPVPAEARPAARRALQELAAGRDLVQAQTPQLIHGDVGPGNILFQGDDVVAIIDFTPLWASELYALCQFLYWHFAAFAGRADGGSDEAQVDEARIDEARIDEALRLYRRAQPGFEPGAEAVRVTLVLAAAYRLFGPVLAAAAGTSAYAEAVLLHRARLLAAVLDAGTPRG